MRYDVELEYVPGQLMTVADTLSRAPCRDSELSEVESEFMGTDLGSNEVYVSECGTMKHTAMEFECTDNTDKSRKKLLQAARQCEEYRETIKAWYEGWEYSSNLAWGEFWSAKDALFESEGLLFHDGTNTQSFPSR